MPSKSSTHKKPTESASYENNPFKVALDGINLVFTSAKGVAILLIVLSIISVFTGIIPDSSEKPGFDSTAFLAGMERMSPGEWIVTGGVVSILVLAFIFASAMISGIGAYTAARTARGHNIKLSEAFHAVLDRFFSYIWLQIIQMVKILLWSLLLIIPGFIMAIRYSLANVAFFDKNLRGNQAIKESLSLTKGAWLTTFASQSLFNLVTLGVISELVTTGARSVLYRQLSQFKEGAEKPAAHMLSWITLFLPLMLIGLLFLLIMAFVVLAAALGLSFS